MNRFQFISNSVGHKLELFLELSGMTKKELAVASGVSRATIHKILYEFSNPKMSTIAKLETAMNNTELHLIKIRRAT